MELVNILFTVICFSIFIIILLITYRRGASKKYEDIANTIVDDEDVLIDVNNNNKNSKNSDNGAQK